MSDNTGRVVLVVDDNDAGRYLVNRTLKKAGFSILEASSGEEAICLMEKHPDLVLLDVNMPDLSGFEVCQYIKSREEYAHIPIVHLSATFVDYEHKVYGLDKGADGYLTHPIEPGELIATVNAFLRIKDVEETLRRANQVWHATFDAVNDAICVLDEQNQVVYCNSSFASLTESQPEDLRGRHCWEVVHGATEPIPDCPYSSSRQNGTRSCCEFQRGDRWFSSTTDPLCNDDGAFQGVVHVFHDVTKQKAAEQAIKNSEERFRLAISATRAVVYDIDLERRQVLSMYGLNDLLGYDLADVEISFDWLASITHADDVQSWCESMRSDVQSLADSVRRYRVFHRDGRELHVEDHRRPICNDSGMVTRVVGTVIDITDKVVATESLESMLATRAEFLATCSHELKTPLTVLLASIDMFMHMYEKLDGQQRAKFLDTMGNQTRKLNRLVTDLLDVSRIESGHMTVAPTQVTISELVGQVVTDFIRTCSTHTIVYKSEGDCTVSVDKMRFEQSLINLLNNAAKYSKVGATISVSLNCLDDKVKISVTDEGCGIPEKDLPRLFERYYRNPSTESTSGLGVGLYLSLELMRLHGGTITVKSEVDKGSTFSLILPRCS